MPRVAIVAFHGCLENYDIVADSITEWEEISQEDLETLVKYISNSYKVIVAEQVKTSDERLIKSVKQAIAFAEKTKRQYEEEAKKYQERKAKRKEKRDKVLYEKLKKEFENNVSQS
jgi:hypothetical protein